MIRRALLLVLCCLVLTAIPAQASECAHEYVEMREEPGCDYSGVAWQECVLCGYETGYTLLDPVGHSFAQWYVTTAPTCTREGVQVRDCTVCGARETAPVPPSGHAYAAEVKHPTCTAGGYTRFNCQFCTSYYIADYTQPLGHSYNIILLREPTDTARGQVRFTCTRCSESHVTYYTFRDIDSDAYYFTPVLWALDAGITSGLDDTHFGPAALCSRAQVVTFLWRSAGKPEPVSAANPFLDVPKGSFCEKAVLWAYETGITTGTDATHFSPNASCNRAEVVTFLHRFRGCPEPEEGTGFPDVPAGSFCHKAVLWAAQKGITLGMDDGTFRPLLPCNRAQIVTFLYRDNMNP